MELEVPSHRAIHDESVRETELATSLVRAREIRRVTQAQLAAATGIKQPVIARVERGQTPAVATLRKLAAALNARVTIEPDGRTTFTTL
ncbi:MAG: helix-turn-helix transcriptional regulator [Capsulimonadaceae bacterium]|nr:helix-turn-helix transcriptional regulator [Capsulimonadaceae bacterium]